MEAVNLQELLPCYNCIEHPRILCGMYQLGCILCRKYGDGRGKLYGCYNPKTEQLIVSKDDGTEFVFKHPGYDCIYCKDTRKTETKLHISEFLDETYSNPFHDMPIILLPCTCCTCTSEQRKLLLEQKHQMVIENAASALKNLNEKRNLYKESQKKLADSQMKAEKLIDEFITDSLSQIKSLIISNSYNQEGHALLEKQHLNYIEYQNAFTELRNANIDQREKLFKEFEKIKKNTLVIINDLISKN